MERLWLDLYNALREERIPQAIDTAKQLLRFYQSGDKDLHSFYNELLNEDVFTHLKDVELIKCSHNQVIIREGEPSSAMYILISGHVDVTTAPPKSKGVVLPLPPVLINFLVANLVQGRKISIIRLGPGTVLGEISALSSKPASATVTSFKETALIKIPKDIIDTVMAQKPNIKSLFSDMLIERLERTSDSLRNAGKKINTCVASAVYSKVKQTVDDSKLSDTSLDGKIASVAKSFNRYEGDDPIKEPLADLEALYKLGLHRDALIQCVKLGSIIIKDFLNDLKPTKEDIKSMVDNAAEKFSFITKAVLRRPSPLPLTSKEQPDIDTEAIGSSDNFLSLFNKKIVENLDRSNIKTFKDKETVFNYGDESDEVYIVKSGNARAALPSGEDIAQMSAGNIFGEFAFVTGNPRTADVIADGDLTVYELKRPQLEKILDDNPTIWKHFDELYQQHVNEMIDRINATKEEFKRLS
ncbi:Cyclic nucleotide-binding domain protein [Candidatus Magnetoovum chiemensis]|nr:Cyclic nucleotide-binding domain protein [Candidatus Magnetoovum chiemensis]